MSWSVIYYLTSWSFSGCSNEQKRPEVDNKVLIKLSLAKVGLSVCEIKGLGKSLITRQRTFNVNLESQITVIKDD